MKKTLKMAALVAAVTGSAYYLLMNTLFKMAFTENGPIKLTPTIKNSPYEEDMARGARWLHGHDRHVVYTQSREGLTLKGHLIETPKAKRTVVMVHGWHGAWDGDFAPCAKWFYEHGCNLLIIEQRSQNGNSGKYMTLGVKESQDVLCWLDWMRENDLDQLPAYLYGISMGSTTVLMASGQKLPDFVKGTIADCGFNSPYQMLDGYRRKNLPLPKFPIMPSLEILCRLKAGFSLRSHTAVKAMKTCHVPVLFIHGTADDFVPARYTMEIYGACSSPKKLLLVEGAAHTLSFLKDKRAYTAAVTSFFRRYDSGHYHW